MTPGATVSAQDRSGLSLMFEGGGQPISGAGGVIPDPIQKGTD